MKIFGVWILLMVISLSSKSAGDLIAEKSNSGTFYPITKLKVFLERRYIDYDYVRRTVSFVDFVNDPKAADVHIIVTRTGTGSGGANYRVNFYSLSMENIGDITLNCMSSPGDTQSDIRLCVTRALKLGLMPYVNETSNGDMIDIQYAETELEETIQEKLDDPWNLWVFRMDLNSGFNIEESKKGYNYALTGRADKVTELMKTRAMYWMRNQSEEIENGDKINYKEVSRKFLRLQNVYSLSDRWSAGLFLTYNQISTMNTRSSINVKPAVEYSFFPWEEADKRTFTVSYFAGAVFNDYYVETIYGKLNENLWAHNMNVNFELVQPWGEFETSIEGFAYWHDMSKNRVSFDTGLSLRVTRGLSLRFGLKASSIHDELWTPKGEYSLEDILLGNVHLPSSFDVSGSMGLRIQFGSLYNNIINNRL